MQIPKTKDDSILIGITGDVMIGRLVDKVMEVNPPSYIWGDTLPLITSTDFNLFNLEAALTTCKEEVFKVFNFKADPNRVESLLLAKTSLVNLANNHSLDYTEKGLIETLGVLDKANIPHVGAGINIEDAKKAHITNVHGINIGIIGLTDNEPGWKAGITNPGTNYVEIVQEALEDVKRQVTELKKKVDILILTIHWGPNMRQRPPQHFIDFAHALIEAGVDIFHGHSAHIFQGMEIYKNRVIFYDTGDFIDDYYVDPTLRNDRSFFFVVEVNKKGPLACRLYPTKIGRSQVNLSSGLDQKETNDRMVLLSKEFNTDLKIENGSLVNYLF